jgi:adenosylcobinamide kinase/adenosylcobinamide-phosphate guanylyltransferase
VNIHLVTGGARSGKSTYAEQMAARLGGENVLYIATAEPGDAEMRERIAAHRERRSAHWQTIEMYRAAGSALTAHARAFNLLDCLTLLTANAYLSGGTHAESHHAVQAEVDALLAAASALPGEFIVVTNEIGMGVVPDTPIGRGYRDSLGWANQRVASAASSVTLLISGVPLVIKSV